MSRYVLVRQNGKRPSVEFLGAFSRSSRAKAAAEQLSAGLPWHDVGNPGGPLQVAEPTSGDWQHYAIVRLQDDQLLDPPIVL